MAMVIKMVLALEMDTIIIIIIIMKFLLRKKWNPSMHILILKDD